MVMPFIGSILAALLYNLHNSLEKRSKNESAEPTRITTKHITFDKSRQTSSNSQNGLLQTPLLNDPNLP